MQSILNITNTFCPVDESLTVVELKSRSPWPRLIIEKELNSQVRISPLLSPDEDITTSHLQPRTALSSSAGRTVVV